MKISGWCVAAGLLLVAGCGKQSHDDAPKDAATAPALASYGVSELAGKVRDGTAPPMGTRVRVTGRADDHVTFGFAETRTRLDVLPESKDAGVDYVMCVGSERRDMTLDAVKGQPVVIEGTLAPIGGAFPALRPCRIVSP